MNAYVCLKEKSKRTARMSGITWELVKRQAIMLILIHLVNFTLYNQVWQSYLLLMQHHVSFSITMI